MGILRKLVRYRNNFHVCFAPVSVQVSDLHSDYLGCVLLYHIVSCEFPVDFSHYECGLILNQISFDSLLLISACFVHEFKKTLNCECNQVVLICYLGEILVQELQKH